jgi:valyl-tRNA synthetase
MARLETIDAGVGLKKPPTSAAAVVGDMTIFVPLGDVIDLDAERARLSKEAEKVEKMVRTSERKLANRDFLTRAPEEVVERERARRDDLATRHEAIQAQLESLAGDE